MEGIRKCEHPTTETFLAAKVRSIELRWKDIVEGLLRVGKYFIYKHTYLVM